MKVFGIGWAKTGTTTLAGAFRLLGYEHQGQRLDLMEDLMVGRIDRIKEVAEIGQVFEDWPWIVLYRELDEWFPDSKFILTSRDPQAWLKSYRRMLNRQMDDYIKTNNDLSGGWPSARLKAIREFLYGLDFSDISDEDLLRRFTEHYRGVKDYFKNRPGDLLVVDWEKGDGWFQLCQFLGRPFPLPPFPHLNRSSI